MSLQTDPLGRQRFLPEEILGQNIDATLGSLTPGTHPYIETGVARDANAPFYSYHLGDVFGPGAAAWVLDQKHETPLMAIWGNGLMLLPNRGIGPYPSTPVYADSVPPLQAPFIPRMARDWGALGVFYGTPPVNGGLAVQVNSQGGFDTNQTWFGAPPNAEQDYIYDTLPYDLTFSTVSPLY